MLNYHPDKRISAQELLSHKWLTMPANFDYTMSDKEYQKSVIIKKTKKPEKLIGEIEEEVKLDVFESDNELNKADEEDNDHGYMSDESDGFNGDEGDQEKDLIQINNFNNSFAAYGQYINLSACDRPNPQFNAFR